MIDIHCHILHGIDDGAGNLNDSVEMAQLAADTGTKAIVVTPHCNIPGVFQNYWGADLAERFNLLRNEIIKRNIPVELYSGQEVFLSKHFHERLDNGMFITVNNSRYMLVELDFRIDEATALSRLQKLVSRGIVPIVAHPERYGFVIENPNVIKRIKEAGSLVQVNSCSILGYFGRHIQKTAAIIADSRLADFIASDAHSQYNRTPNLLLVHEYICENIAYDYADVLLNINPEKILNDETI